MKRIKKSKLIISIILLSLLIIEVITIGLSRAGKTIDITITAIDSQSALGNKEEKIEATKNEDGTYSLTFPKTIEGFNVKSYSLTREYTSYQQDEAAIEQELEAANVSINDINTNITIDEIVGEEDAEDEETEEEPDENNLENVVIEKSEAQLTYENIVASHTTEIVTTQDETYNPGTTVVLTKTEQKTKKISIQVTYDTKKKDDNTYYKQTLKANTVYNNKATTVEVEAYVPLNSKLVLKSYSSDQKDNISYSLLSAQPDDKFSFYDVYAPTILYSADTNELDMTAVNDNNLQEFNASSLSEEIVFTLSNLNNAGFYKLYAVNETAEDYSFAELGKVEGVNTISYKNTGLGKYALLYDPSYNLEAVESATLVEENVLRAAASDGTVSKWDGSIATGLSALDSTGAAGNPGTINNPYLITSGADLAYIAQQVNGGTTYSQTYFNLVVNIDLDGRTWTPIGNGNRSFQGIFDGQGHNIINGVISNNTMPGNNTYIYLGLFGSIGNNNSASVVKNLELKNFTINETATGNLDANRGYYIGSIVGGLFRNATVENCTVLNSTISLGEKASGNQGTLVLRNATARIMVGGAIGGIQTADRSYNDSGNAKPQVKAVHTDVDIIADNVTVQYDSNTQGNWWNQYTTQSNYRHYYSQNFSIGGVVGATIGERTCPEYCSYTGNIKTNEGFAGPIMGGAYSNNNANTAANTNNNAYRNNFEEIFSLSYIFNGANVAFNNYYYNYSITSHTITVRTSQNNYNNATNEQRTFTTNKGTIDGNTVNVGNNYRFVAYPANFPANYTNDSYFKYWQGMNAGLSSSKDAVYQELRDHVFEPEGTPSTYYAAWENTSAGLNLLVPLAVEISQVSGTTTSYSATPDPYSVSLTYKYYWYLDGVSKTTDITNNTVQNINHSWDNDQILMVICQNQDGSIAIDTVTIEKYELHMVFSVSGSGQNATLNSSIEGTGTASPEFSLSNYEYQWYLVDVADGAEIIDGETNTSISGIKNGCEYELRATTTNGDLSYMNVSGSFLYGNRIVVFVNYGTYTTGGVTYTGNDGNDGFTPQTAVRTMATAYGKLRSDYTRDENIIVVMGNYNDNNFINAKNSNTYNKEATLTGKYKGTQWNQTISYGGQKFLCAATTFMYLTFNGNTNGATIYERAIYTEGYSLTMGKGLEMQNMGTYGNSQGCIGNCVAFQVCGPFQPAQNMLNSRPAESEIIIKSGRYGRVLSSGREIQNDNNRWPLGSDNRHYKCRVTIDIQNGVGQNSNEYDVNLLTAGKNNGSVYGDVELNIVNGKIGRVIGGNLGRDVTTSNDRNPRNSYFGSTTINMSGGSAQELYGAGYGRNGSYDVYYYGEIEINLTGGTINANVYGGGAGGVVGYNASNGDRFNTLGSNYTSNIAINIGGNVTITGDVFAGGYGYSSLLDNNARNNNLGKTFGDTTIVVEGGNINGNIYGAGRGYNYNNNNLRNVAQMTGNTHVEIKGGTIGANVYGAGLGIQNQPTIAKLFGTTEVVVDVGPTGSISKDIYGGANFADIDGTTKVELKSGNVSGNVYGGCNRASVTNSTTVSLDGVTSTGLIFGGSNASGTVANTNVNLKSGTGNKVYGGNNSGGLSQVTNVTVTGAAIYDDAANDENDGAIYGGGRQADTNKTNVILTSNTGTIPNVFGGGEEAGVVAVGNINGSGQTYVTVSGTSIKNLFGGSNQDGDINTSNITINNGTITNVYGANNEGGTTRQTNINIHGGTITNTFGGGNEADSHVTHITMDNGTVTNIYGGGNKAGITTQNGVTNSGNTFVTITKGTATNVFGGSNSSGDVVTTNVTIGTSGGTGTGLNVTNVYGGNNEGGTSTTTNVTTFPGTIANVYGGSKGLQNYQEGQTRAYAGTTNVSIKGSHITENLFGGGELAPTTSATNITVSNNSTIDQNVYGGGNQAIVGSQNSNGSTHLSITNSTIKGNAFAAGNGTSAITYGTAYVEILTGSVIGQNYDDTLEHGCVYGGGNQAEVVGNTEVLFNGGTINTHVFGGGNEGRVEGSTKVNAKSGNITGSIYGGGNLATVTENTLVNVYANMKVGSSSSTPPLQGSVFAGGNEAETGLEGVGGSKNILNIAGGEIFGNAYGGANTSKIWGSTVVNIGLKAIQDYKTANQNAYDIPADMTATSLIIHGTVFGGGEANANGSEDYDWSYISATEGIDVNIDGQGYETVGIQFEKSVFGSGNASSSSGTSTIDIYNLGTYTNPNRCISIQRTDILTIKNSSLALHGINDSTNDHATELYTLNYIGDLKLANSSTLYLENTSNCLSKWESLLIDNNGVETPASINISSNGSGTPNVRNNLYLLEGLQLLVIPPAEAGEGYGKVIGMTFLGIYSTGATPYNSIGSYYKDTASNGQTVNYQAYNFTSVLGKHMKRTYEDPEDFLIVDTGEHDLTKAGFYSNKFTIDGVTDEELEEMINTNQIDGDTQGTLRTYYVGATPPQATYYIWSVGNVDMTTYYLNIEASKYDTLGTKELSLRGFAVANTFYAYSGCRFALADGITIAAKSTIPKIANPKTDADQHFGLAMKTGAYGWVNAGSMDFEGSLDSGDYIDGSDTTFKTENAAEGSTDVTPDLEFYLYHSQNIQTDGDLGNIKIYLDVNEPMTNADGFNYRKICVDITLTRKVYQDEYVEQSIQPGKKYEIFTSTRTQIVSDGVFSTYDTIYIDKVSEKERASQYMNSRRVLVSTDLDGVPYYFNAGTKITMLDLVTNQTYYYIVTAADATGANQTNKYYFTKFKKMGSMDEYYDEEDSFDNHYYNATTDELYERYIFHYDFAEAGIEEDVTNKIVSLQLEATVDNEDRTIIELIASQRQEVLYSLFTDSDATIDVEGNVSVNPLYLGKSNEVLKVETMLTQQAAPDGRRIYDTNFFDEQMGVKISLIDALGTQQDSDAMLGVYFTVEGDEDGSGHLKKYYPRIDGSTRIKIGTKVANSISNITMHTEENQSLVTGNYKIRIETYGSVDGYYYGDITSGVYEIPLTIISGIFGLKITSPDEQKIFKNETGLNTSGDNKLDMTVDYSSLLDNPILTLSLQRRNYESIYAKTYEAVDLSEVINGGPTERFNESTFNSDYMYKVADKDDIGEEDTKVYHYTMKSKVPTGTYKMVYSIYDGNTYIGSAYEYFIVN